MSKVVHPFKWLAETSKSSLWRKTIQLWSLYKVFCTGWRFEGTFKNSHRWEAFLLLPLWKVIFPVKFLAETFETSRWFYLISVPFRMLYACQCTLQKHFGLHAGLNKFTLIINFSMFQVWKVFPLWHTWDTFFSVKRFEIVETRKCFHQNDNNKNSHIKVPTGK